MSTNVSHEQDVSPEQTHCQSQLDKLSALDGERALTSTESMPQTEVHDPRDNSSQLRNASNNFAALSSIFPGGSVSLANGYTPDASLLPRVRLKKLYECDNGEPPSKKLCKTGVASASEDESKSSRISLNQNVNFSSDLVAGESQSLAGDLRQSRRVKSHLMQRQRLAKDYILELDESNTDDEHVEPEQVSVARANDTVARDSRFSDDDKGIRAISKTSKGSRTLVNASSRRKDTTSATHTKTPASRGSSRKHKLADVQTCSSLQDNLNCSGASHTDPVVAELSASETGVRRKKAEQPKKSRQLPTCNNPWCLLGCICKSLKSAAAASRRKRHCGRVKCMLSCCCDIPPAVAKTRLRPKLRQQPVGPGSDHRGNHQTGVSAARTRGTPVVWIPHGQAKSSITNCNMSTNGDPALWEQLSRSSMGTKSAGSHQLSMPNELCQPLVSPGDVCDALDAIEVQSDLQPELDIIYVSDVASADLMSLAPGCTPVEPAKHAQDFTTAICVEADNVIVVDDDDEEHSFRPSEHSSMFRDGAVSGNFGSRLAAATENANGVTGSLPRLFGKQLPKEQLRLQQLQLRMQQLQRDSALMLSCSDQAAASIVANHPQLNQLLSNFTSRDPKEQPSQMQPILEKVPQITQQQQPLLLAVDCVQQQQSVVTPLVEQSSLPLLNAARSLLANRGSSSTGVPRNPGSVDGSSEQGGNGKHKASVDVSKAIYDRLAAAVAKLGNQPPLKVPGSTIATLLVFKRCMQPSLEPPMQLKVVSANNEWESNCNVRHNILTISSQLADDEPQDVLKVAFEDYLMYIYPKNHRTKTGVCLSPGSLSKEPRYIVLTMVHRSSLPAEIIQPPAAFEQQSSVPSRRPLGQFRDPAGRWIPWSRRASPGKKKAGSPKSPSSTDMANMQLPRVGADSACSGTQQFSTGSSAAATQSQGNMQLASLSSHLPGPVVTYTPPSSQGAALPLLSIVSEPATSALSTASSTNKFGVLSHPQADNVSLGYDEPQDLNAESLRHALEPAAVSSAAVVAAAAGSHTGTSVDEGSEQVVTATVWPAACRSIGVTLYGDSTHFKGDCASINGSLQPLSPRSSILRNLLSSLTPANCEPEPALSGGSGTPAQIGEVSPGGSWSYSAATCGGRSLCCHPRDAEMLELTMAGATAESVKEAAAGTLDLAATFRCLESVNAGAVNVSAPEPLQLPVAAQQVGPELAPAELGPGETSEIAASDAGRNVGPRLGHAESHSWTLPIKVEPAEITQFADRVQGRKPSVDQDQPIAEACQVAVDTGNASGSQRQLGLGHDEPRSSSVKATGWSSTKPSESDLHLGKGQGGEISPDRVLSKLVQQPTTVTSLYPEVVKKEPCEAGRDRPTIPPLSVLFDDSTVTFDIAMDHPDMVEPGVLMTFDIEDNYSTESEFDEDNEELELNKSPCVDGEPNFISCKSIPVASPFKGFGNIGSQNDTCHHLDKSLPCKGNLNGSCLLTETGADHYEPVDLSNAGRRPAVHSGYIQSLPLTNVDIMNAHTRVPGAISSVDVIDRLCQSVQTSNPRVDNISVPSSSKEGLSAGGSHYLTRSESIAGRYYLFEDHDDLFGFDSGSGISTGVSKPEQVTNGSVGVPNKVSIITDVADSCNGALHVYQQDKERAEYSGSFITSLTSSSSPTYTDDGGSRSTEPPRAYSPASIGWLGYGNDDIVKGSLMSETAERSARSSAYDYTVSVSDDDDFIDVERVDLDECPVSFQNSAAQQLKSGHDHRSSCSAESASYQQTNEPCSQQSLRHKSHKARSREVTAHHNSKEKTRRRSLSLALGNLCDEIDLSECDNPSIVNILIEARHYIHKLKLSEIHNRTEMEMLIAQRDQLRSDHTRLMQEVSHLTQGPSNT